MQNEFQWFYWLVYIPNLSLKVGYQYSIRQPKWFCHAQRRVICKYAHPQQLHMHYTCKQLASNAWHFLKRQTNQILILTHLSHRALCVVWRSVAGALSRSLRWRSACKSFPVWRSGRGGGAGRGAEARGPRPPPPLRAHPGVGSPWKQPLEQTPGPQLSPWQLLPPAPAAKLTGRARETLRALQRALFSCAGLVKRPHSCVMSHLTMTNVDVNTEKMEGVHLFLRTAFIWHV